MVVQQTRKQSAASGSQTKEFTVEGKWENSEDTMAAKGFTTGAHVKHIASSRVYIINKVSQDPPRTPKKPLQNIFETNNLCKKQNKIITRSPRTAPS